MLYKPGVQIQHLMLKYKRKKKWIPSHFSCILLTRADLIRLREAIIQAFNLEELEVLCADITQMLALDEIYQPLNTGMLEGNSLPEKAQSLIDYCERRGWLEILIREVNKVCPNLWIQDVFLTSEGRQRALSQLESLRTAGRAQVAQYLHDAKEAGDVIDNTAYEDAKNEQARLEGCILELEQFAGKSQAH